MQLGREWTKFAVRFREVSGLESVRLERVDCIHVKLFGSSDRLGDLGTDTVRRF